MGRGMSKNVPIFKLPVMTRHFPVKRDMILSLNAAQKNRRIRFRGDRRAEGVPWEVIGEPAFDETGVLWVAAQEEFVEQEVPDDEEVQATTA
jgi:hypothetical protein